MSRTIRAVICTAFNRRRSHAVVALLALGGTASVMSCKGTEPFVAVPHFISFNVESLSFSGFGQNQSITASVSDQNGDAMPDAVVTWESSDLQVVVVAGSGHLALVTAQGNGTAQIRAHVGGIMSSIDVSVAQVLAFLVKTQGDGQVDTIGSVLPIELVAQARDVAGNPMSNIPVDFTITSGNGSLSAVADTSGADGLIRVRWNLGTGVGLQSVFVGVHGGTIGTTFNATAQAGAPITLTVVAGDSQRAAIGKSLPVPPAVRLRDTYNNPVPGASVAFAATSGGGSVGSANVTTNASGIAATAWILGALAGENQLTVTGPAGLSHVFTALAVVSGPPAAVVIVAGDSQVGLANYALNIPPVVRVEDSTGIPLSGVALDFAPSAGGSVTSVSQMTDSVGLATVGWRVALGPNTLTVSASGTGAAPATITASGQTPQFNIELRYLTPVTAQQKTAFENARARWQQVIFGDLEDVFVNNPAGTCGAGTPPIAETVDDIIIYVRLDSIDGVGKILGQASPCIVRVPSYSSVVGVMHFDTADVATLLDQGRFDAVILHEMGHVLGFTAGIWSHLGLVVGRVADGGTDPHFVGVTATDAFNRLGGSGYSGAKVPLENCSGCNPGTLDSHWRESVFDVELMTGFIELSVTVPLSRITASAFGDLGYLVNNAASDPYTVAHVAALRADVESRIELKDDVLPLRIIAVDRSGRTVRIIMPH